MPSQVTQQIDMGLNSLIPQNMRNPRESGDRPQNLIYNRGLAETPEGFAALNLTAGLGGATDPVLAVFPYREIDGYDHLMAKTAITMYEYDRIAGQWTDKGFGTDGSDADHPISWAAVGHNDTDIYIDDNASSSKAYFHLVVCDGGLTDIQRWAGRYETDFGYLLGADDYHEGVYTKHRAKQVNTFRSRLILISPKVYTSGGAWREQRQQVRWPRIGKLEMWSGTGSSYAELIDTGGTNVWAENLGTGQFIIYQTVGIWTLNYVGGDNVFAPDILFPDLGLLGPHCIENHNNVHYFLGNDYNVYAYHGGTVKRVIGDKIHKNLQDDLDPSYEHRCWMVMSPKSDFLWLFIVPNGKVYATKAYGMNMQSGAWMVRDLESYFSSGGMASVATVGDQAYTIGDTYEDNMQGALATWPTYADVVGDTYAEELQSVLTEPRMIMGDGSGWVYQFDPTYTKDGMASGGGSGGELITQRHPTPIFDGGHADIKKRWPGISVVACGSADGAMTIKHRQDNFDTSDTGWTDMSFDLTTEWKEKKFFINKTSEGIQFEFADWSGKAMKVKEFKILNPEIEEDR